MSVCVCPSLPLCLSIRIRIRGCVGTVRVCLIPGCWRRRGGETGGERREGAGHPQPGPWLAQLHRPSGRGPGGLAGTESDPCRLGEGGEGGEEQGGTGRGRAGGGQYLSDAKGDVAHVETAGLPGHLAPDHRHGRWGHGQTIRGHGGEEGGGWNLTRSFERKEENQRMAGCPWTRRAAARSSTDLNGAQPSAAPRWPHRAKDSKGRGPKAPRPQREAPTLHGLVLHGGDVLEAWRRHVPVLADLLLLLMTGGPAGGGRGRAGRGNLSLTKGGPAGPPRRPLPPTPAVSPGGRGSGTGPFQGGGNSLPRARAGAGQGRGRWARGRWGTGRGVEGAGREAHINPPCSSLAPLVKGLLGGGRETHGEG